MYFPITLLVFWYGESESRRSTERIIWKYQNWANSMYFQITPKPMLSMLKLLLIYLITATMLNHQESWQMGFKCPHIKVDKGTFLWAYSMITLTHHGSGSMLNSVTLYYFSSHTIPVRSKWENTGKILHTWCLIK